MNVRQAALEGFSRVFTDDLLYSQTLLIAIEVQIALLSYVVWTDARVTAASMIALAGITLVISQCKTNS